MRTVFAVLMTGAILAIPSSAAAATPGCIDHFEYDNDITPATSLNTIRARVDAQGRFENEGPNQSSYSFKACWAVGEKRVWIWFDNIDGLSRRWEVREV